MNDRELIERIKILESRVDALIKSVEQWPPFGYDDDVENIYMELP